MTEAQNSEQSEANNPNSDEQNRNNDSNKKEAKTFNPSTFPELLWLLIATKQGCFGILATSLMLVAAICGTTWLLVTKIIPPENKIEIQTPVASFTITNGDISKTFLSLSPTGGDEDTAWVKTGIKIKKGDDVEIAASGRVNTAMRTIVAQATRPGFDNPTWVGPNGLSGSNKPRQSVDSDFYDDKKLKPDDDTHYGFGMLLTAVKTPTEDVKPESIYPFPQEENVPLEFTAEKDGELVLTVNDIWLGSKKKHVYAPEFKGQRNIEHYEQLAAAEATFKDDPTSWSPDKKRRKAKEQYRKRDESWKSVEANKNWNVWYDDNIGSFSVAVIVESKTK